MKPQVDISDLGKLDLRVGEVLTAEEVFGSNKLLKLTVDFSEFTKIIYSGIKHWYSSENLIGRKFIFVVNLAPRVFKIGDQELVSEGMILAASDDRGLPAGRQAILYRFDKDVSNGTQIH